MSKIYFFSDKIQENQSLIDGYKEKWESIVKGGIRMNEVNNELKEYVKNFIFPIYDKNDAGHGIDHIQYVIRRSIAFAHQFENIDLDMVYAIASFHDLGHHIDKDNHEKVSAKLFYENKKMHEFFSEEQRKIIKEAIEDHRASLDYEPRSNYGKIISSADRNVEINSSLKRTHDYSVKHYPELDLPQMITRAYNHLYEKFGNCGYAKMWCYDEEFDNFKKEVAELLQDKYKFAVRYMEVNNIMDIKEKAKLFAIGAHIEQEKK